MCVSGYGNLDEPTPQVKLALGITLLFFTMLGILGNIVISVIVFKVLRSRRTLHNVLILVLAVTDLLTICLAFPPALLAYLSGLDVGHAPLCNYHGTVLNFFYIISVMLVTCMSLDRYLALSRPFFYKTSVVFDSKMFVVIFTSLCVFALLVSLLPVFGLSANVLQYPRTFCLFRLNARDYKGKIVVFLNLFLLMLCLVTVLGCNSAVSWTSLRMLERSRQRQRSVDTIETSSNFSACSTEECQFLKLSVIVMVAFLGCWSLFFVSSFFFAQDYETTYLF